jgi:hypothetical protein
MNEDAMIEEFARAIDGGDLETVESMLRVNAELANAEHPRFRDPVICHSGDGRIAECLLRHGANVQARGGDSETGLHSAVKGGHRDVVTVLIAHGADVNAVDGFGRRPLELAVVNCDGDISALLLAAGAEYTLLAAVGRSDVRRVRELMAAEPSMMAELGPDERYRLINVLSYYISPEIGGVGSLEDRLEIVRLLYESGLSRYWNEVNEFVENYGDAELREYVRRLKTAGKR